MDILLRVLGYMGMLVLVGIMLASVILFALMVVHAIRSLRS